MDRIALVRLLESTGCAERHDGFTFLVDPNWTDPQRAQFNALLKSEVVANTGQGWLCIPTGGSSGTVRFARHDESTLGAAVKGFCAHFDLSQVNVVDVLPPWHVSGLLARVRSAATGGRHVPWDWKRLAGSDYPVLEENIPWLLSLVPTQLQRLLNQPSAKRWMERLSLVIVGGGPVWADLAAEARNSNIPIVISYGMTETAAMVASQTVNEFKAGDRSCGYPLPHARVMIRPELSEAIHESESGIVCVSGESVMRGYFPNFGAEGNFETADFGRVDADGRLHIDGRRDDVIITGGEKVNLREVEAVLCSTGSFSDVAVVAVSHPEWGEEMVACYLAEVAISPTEIDALVSGVNLARHQRPKRYLAIPAANWPRNAQGKLNRTVLREAILAR